MERKFLSVKDRKVHALLFAHSFETKIGFGSGLASYMKTEPESALRKHPIAMKNVGYKKPIKYQSRSCHQGVLPILSTYIPTSYQ